MKKNKIWILLAAGVLAGFTNGMLGAGGGIILIEFMSASIPEYFKDSKDMFAAALTVMLPVSAFSVLIFALRGKMPTELPFSFLLPAAAGGAAGAFLLSKIRTGMLRVIFAVITLWSGISMLTR